MSNNRNRAWRRFKKRINRSKGMGSGELHKPEKNWKLMYLRRNKLARAKQLGFDYPVKNQRQIVEQEVTSNESLFDEE